MIKTIKKKLLEPTNRKNAALGILGVVAVAIALWYIWGSYALVDILDPQIPLSNLSTSISAGDTVVLNVFAAELDDVYGYQFDIHFDRDIIDYSNRLYSEIEDITMIFTTDKEWFLLVGATMIGDANGYSGQNTSVCRVEFVAQTDFELNPDSTSDHIAISNVNVVTSDKQYLENMGGWNAVIRRP